LDKIELILIKQTQKKKKEKKAEEMYSSERKMGQMSFFKYHIVALSLLNLFLFYSAASLQWPNHRPPTESPTHRQHFLSSIFCPFLWSHSSKNKVVIPRLPCLTYRLIFLTLSYGYRRLFTITNFSHDIQRVGHVESETLLEKLEVS